MLDAFFVLSHSRSYNGGFCPIAVSEMIVYANAFDVEDKREFISYIQSADSEFMEYQAGKLKNG